MSAYKYNYIFYNFDYEYYDCITKPLSELDNVCIRKKGIDGSFIKKKLFFYHWSKKINKIIRLPLKRLWFPQLVKSPFNNDNPICYVFYSGKYINDSDKLRDYILKQNPDNKCLIYCGDLISKKGWDVEKVKRGCDAIVTYDPGEAEKYGIYCYDKPVFGRVEPLVMTDSFDYDVYFLGMAKDRLPKIHEVYKRLSSAGLRCKFIVCGTKPNDRTVEGIDYSDPIPYSQNIEYIQKSKCLIEIIQGGSNTSTLRRVEAMVYKRKLISDYLDLKKTEYYDPGYMSIFSNSEDIDIGFIKKPVDYSLFKAEEELSPVKLLDFFEKIISGE